MLRTGTEAAPRFVDCGLTMSASKDQGTLAAARACGRKAMATCLQTKPAARRRHIANALFEQVRTGNVHWHCSDEPRLTAPLMSRHNATELDSLRLLRCGETLSLASRQRRNLLRIPLQVIFDADLAKVYREAPSRSHDLHVINANEIKRLPKYRRHEI